MQYNVHVNTLGGFKWVEPYRTYIFFQTYKLEVQLQAFSPQSFQPYHMVLINIIKLRSPKSAIGEIMAAFDHACHDK